jgi:hypothetical protein
MVSVGVLLGAVLGAGGYHLLVRGRPAGSGAQLQAQAQPQPEAGLPCSSPPVSREEMSRVLRMMADAQVRLARLESKPGFEEVLHDPAKRDLLAAVLLQVRSKEMPANPYQDDRCAPLRNLAQRYRDEYVKIVDEARERAGIDEAAWKEVRPIFDKHFAPVDDVLRALAIGRSSTDVKVNKLVSPGLPATLEALRKALPARSWEAFDKWRKEEGSRMGLTYTREDYFLDGQDFRACRIRRAVALHWSVVSQNLPSLYEKLDPEGKYKARLDEAFKAHVTRVCVIHLDENPTAMTSPEGLAKNMALLGPLRDDLKRIAGRDGPDRFREWVETPVNMASIYFGEPLRFSRARGSQPGFVRGSAAPVAPPTIPAQQPAVPGTGPEKF